VVEVNGLLSQEVKDQKKLQLLMARKIAT